MLSRSIPLWCGSGCGVMLVVAAGLFPAVPRLAAARLRSRASNRSSLEAALLRPSPFPPLAAGLTT